MGGKKTGGMNVYIRDMAQELGARGIEVDIFTRRVSRDQPEISKALGPRVRVIAVNAGPLSPLSPDEVYPYLSQFAAGVIAYATRKDAPYDILYSHYWLSGWVAHKLNEVWNTPFIHMFHTLGQMKRRIGAGNTALPDVRIAVETQIVSWAERIIAATPAEQEQLLWLYRADRRKIDIIPPGFDASRFQPLSQREARERLGLASDVNLILFVGRIEPLKAVDTLIESVALLVEQRPELGSKTQLAIIGGDLEDTNDSEMNRLRSMVE